MNYSSRNGMSHPSIVSYLIATIIAFLPHAASAAPSCSINSIAAADFATYNVFSSFANNNGVGSITIRCKGGGSNFLVTLSQGQSNSYAARIMRSGTNTLSYNLYTSAARIVVWGDGSGGSSAMTISGNSTTTLSLFGQIPAGQDVAVGSYSDDISTVINF